MGGLTISGRRKTRTGQLDRRTLLRKRYQIQRVIGQGGMGAVYLAKDMKDQGSLCAIKEMSLSMVSEQDQPQAIENFKVEAKILWSLKHPNLPTLTYFFSQNDRYYLVMEYIDGSTLEDLLENSNGPFPERRVLGWARQLCDVLSYLHSQKPPIIFRDMKPGNIMLTRADGQIKLIDFGIARFFRPKHSQDTQVLGTPGYAPPEQYGSSQTDERSDIYALGMTLFHLLTKTLSEKGFGLQNVHERFPRISPMVARALEKATRIDPAERFESVEAFQNALFGVGSFVFESGDVASTPSELAELCVNYPEEAAEYLSEGEIEAWLRDLEEEDLAQMAHYLQKNVSDPVEAVEELIPELIRARSASNTNYAYNSSTSSSSSSGAMAAIRDTGRHQPVRTSSRLTTGAPTRNTRSRTTPPPRMAPIHVSPGMVDFGTVYPGISSPMNIAVSSDSQIYKVSGQISVSDPWIQLSQKYFDGLITEISVRINSVNLAKNAHYTGKIIITPDDEEQREQVVKVAVDVHENIVRNKRHPGKTHGADLDEEDDEGDDFEEYDYEAALRDPDEPVDPVMDVLPPPQDIHLSEDEAKYISYRVILDDGSIENRWDPSPSPAQREWQLLGLTVSASFMSSSLMYTLLSGIRAHPFPPDPLFLLMLVGIIPAATLGALAVQWEKRWSLLEKLNRALTGAVTTLVGVSLVEGIWQLVTHARLGVLQLLLLLIVASVGATVGMQNRPYSWILTGITRAYTFLRPVRWMLFALAVVIGGGLGYFLTMGYVFSWYTFLAILLGIATVLAIVLRIEYLDLLGRRQKV